MRKKLTIGVVAALIPLVGVWLLYPPPAAPVKVVGSLSAAAVEDIVDIIRSQKQARVSEALFRGRFRQAWYWFDHARRSSVEAIYEIEDGSVRVVSAVRWPDQTVRRHTNGMSGWTGSWPGTRGQTNTPGH
jgi:hypothetical protein